MGTRTAPGRTVRSLDGKAQTRHAAASGPESGRAAPRAGDSCGLAVRPPGCSAVHSRYGQSAVAPCSRCLRVDAFVTVTSWRKSNGTLRSSPTPRRYNMRWVMWLCSSIGRWGADGELESPPGLGHRLSIWPDIPTVFLFLSQCPQTGRSHFKTVCSNELEFR